MNFEKFLMNLLEMPMMTNEAKTTCLNVLNELDAEFDNYWKLMVKCEYKNETEKAKKYECYTVLIHLKEQGLINVLNVLGYTVEYIENKPVIVAM